ncbi:hypothetical protein MMC18_002327 [Xylographa bjoerkii]|nr:hypothetical protein [Xylographa bjoerkii]
MPRGATFPIFWSAEDVEGYYKMAVGMPPWCCSFSILPLQKDLIDRSITITSIGNMSGRLPTQRSQKSSGSGRQAPARSGQEPPSQSSSASLPAPPFEYSGTGQPPYQTVAPAPVRGSATDHSTNAYASYGNDYSGVATQSSSATNYSTRDQQPHMAQFVPEMNPLSHANFPSQPEHSLQQKPVPQQQFVSQQAYDPSQASPFTMDSPIRWPSPSEFWDVPESSEYTVTTSAQHVSTSNTGTPQEEDVATASSDRLLTRILPQNARRQGYGYSNINSLTTSLLNPHDWAWICCKCGQDTFQGETCLNKSCPERSGNGVHRLCFIENYNNCRFKDRSLDKNVEKCMRASYDGDFGKKGDIETQIQLRVRYLTDIAIGFRRPLEAKDLTQYDLLERDSILFSQYCRQQVNLGHQ